jgi:hypothetical protein
MILASSAKVGSGMVSFVLSSSPGIADTRLIGFQGIESVEQMCDARVDLLKPRNSNLQAVKPNASNRRTSKTNVIY